MLKVVVAGLLFAYLIYLVYRNSPPKGTVFACLFFLPYFFFQYCEEVDKVLSASSNLHTFDAIIEDIQWPVDISLMVIGGEKFGVIRVSPINAVTVVGLLALTSFRSGMPAYVFNTQGILIDSTLDHHDDPLYQDRWGTPAQKKQITKNEFLAMIQENKE